MNAVTLDQPAPISSPDRLGLTLFCAILLHIAFILGVSFDITKNKPELAERTLEVMVVQKPKESEPPKEADFLAQASQEGSGILEEKAKPTESARPAPTPAPIEVPLPVTPAPAIAPPTPEPAPAPKPTPDSAPEPTRVLTSQQAVTKIITEKPTQSEIKPRKLSPSQLLASTNREIARLNAEIIERSTQYARRPRRKAINASTKEYLYANYLDGWRRKVERVGNLNYPDEARRKKLYGNLVLHVAVKTDGSVEQVRLLRSSGHKILDDAAMRIVRLSAPFAPFPAEIREKTDILDITRTWQFQSNNKLGWKN